MAETPEKKKKEAIPRQKMPEQEARVRARNFEEVPFGYPAELAKLEASRCLQCKKPACVAGCPVSIDIPSFIWMILQDDFLGAARKLKEMNTLPAVCGRVCPQEDQCEKVCILGKKGEPVAIGRLERFAADHERNSRRIRHAPESPAHGEKSGGGGIRAGGVDRSRRPHQEGTPGDHFRGPAQSRGRSRLWNPGIPTSQSDRPGGSGLP